MQPYDPEMAATMKRLYDSLNEKSRRHYAGIEALKLGFGGRRYIAGVLGCSRRTVSKGAREVSGLSTREVEVRIRQQGGGRKDYQTQWPGIDEPFLGVLYDHTAGDPMDETVRWTNLSLEEIVTTLWEDHDIQVSQSVVRQLLKKHGYRRRKAQKKCTMKHRNEQFENIARLKAEYEAAGHPIISLDTKKKEDLGKSCTSMTMISRALPKGWSSPMLSTMCGVTSATCTWEPAMIPVHSPVIAFATGGIPMGKSTIGRPPPFWCCVMAGEATALGTTSLNKTSKRWPMKSASKSASPITRPTAPNTTPLSIACSPM